MPSRSGLILELSIALQAYYHYTPELFASRIQPPPLPALVVRNRNGNRFPLPFTRNHGSSLGRGRRQEVTSADRSMTPKAYILINFVLQFRP